MFITFAQGRLTKYPLALSSEPGICWFYAPQGLEGSAGVLYLFSYVGPSGRKTGAKQIPSRNGERLRTSTPKRSIQ